MPVEQKRRLIQDQARLEPLCAAPDPRTDSNWACLRTPPFVSVAQNENPASCFRPGRAGRVPQPSLVRSPLDSPIEPLPALLNADLFCLRFPAEATLTLVDWHVAQPSTCCFQLAFDGGRGPPGESVVVRSVCLGLQSALERALPWVSLVIQV